MSDNTRTIFSNDNGEFAKIFDNNDKMFLISYSNNKYTVISNTSAKFFNTRPDVENYIGKSIKWD